MSSRNGTGAPSSTRQTAPTPDRPGGGGPTDEPVRTADGATRPTGGAVAPTVDVIRPTTAPRVEGMHAMSPARALDSLDDLDRRIVVALQQDGRASWRAVAATVGSSVATVARRGQQLIADGVVRIVVLPALGSTGQVDAFLVRVNCHPGTTLAVATELVGLGEVRFLSIVTGGFDIIAELVVHGGATHYPRLVEQVQAIAGISRWRSDLILHVHKVGHDWGRQLLDQPAADQPTADQPAADQPAADQSADEPAAEPAPGSVRPTASGRPDVPPERCAPDHLDGTDQALLAALADDGRRPFTHVADELAINESSVRRRFDRMRAAGCLDVITLVPAPALGMGAETLMTVRVAPDRLDQVAAELAGHPAVRYIAATLDDSSLFCEVIASSTAQLHLFITGTLSRLTGVQGWSAAMELLSMKRGFVETPWWRAQVPAAAPP